jgi:hypothetical protein
MPHGQKEETKKCHGIICNKCGEDFKHVNICTVIDQSSVHCQKKDILWKLRTVLQRESCFSSTVPSVIYYGTPVPVQRFLMIDWSLAYWINIFLKQCLSWRVPERHCVHDFKTPITPPPLPLTPPPIVLIFVMKEKLDHHLYLLTHHSFVNTANGKNVEL